MDIKRQSSASRLGLPSLVTACLVLTAALAMAGCGSGGGSGTATGESSGSSPTTTPAEEPAGGEAASSGKPELGGLLSQEQVYAGFETDPPSSGPPAVKGKKVYWISCGEEALTCAAPAKAAEEAGKVLGWEVKTFDGKLSPEGELAATRAALAANPDAIIVHAVNCAYVAPALREAKERHIPVLGMEALGCAEVEPGEEELYTVKMEFSELTPSVTEYLESMGTIGGSYAVDAQHEEAKVVWQEFEGNVGIPINEGFKKAVEACPGCELLENVPYSEGDNAPGGKLLPAFEASLVKNPDYNSAFITFCINMGVSGGAKAVKRSANPNAVIVGGDGGLEGMELVRSGEVTEVTAKDVRWTAWASLDELNRYFHGDPTVPEGVGWVGVDKEHNLPPKEGEDYASSKPWQKAYEKIWKGSGA
jgi:ribose transport system substrate-binding protein